MPIQIDGESFMLELDNIKNIDVIDLDDDSSARDEQRKQQNVLDKINGATSKNLRREDKAFFKETITKIREDIDPKGEDWVPPRKSGPANNFDK